MHKDLLIPSISKMMEIIQIELAELQLDQKDQAIQSIKLLKTYHLIVITAIVIEEVIKVGLSNNQEDNRLQTIPIILLSSLCLNEKSQNSD